MTTKGVSTTGTDIGGYLFKEHPLVVRPELARTVGLNEAIVLQQVYYWCQKNEGKNHNSRDGFTWTYGSYEFWQSQFSWWSVHTVRRVFANLERAGLLISRRFNHLPQDRTKWYRVDEDELRRRLAKLPGHVSKMDTSTGQNGPMQESNLDRPLPETNQRLTSETIHNGDEEGENSHSFDQTAAKAAAGILDFFKQNFPKIEFTPAMREELEGLAMRFQPAWVQAAIKEARRHKVDSPLPYIGKVLENKEKEKASAEKKENGHADGKFYYDSAPHVWVTEEEVLDLAKRFGNDGAAARINFLSKHKGSTGKSYESDYETILLWDARGNWNPKPQGWEINQQWLDSLRQEHAQTNGRKREWVDVVCRWCNRTFRAQKPKDGSSPINHCNRRECVDKDWAEWRQRELAMQPGPVYGRRGGVKRATSLDQLTLNEQRVLELRFGLRDRKHPTREIADELHVCASRVRELEVHALNKLYGDGLSLKEQRERFAEDYGSRDR